MPSSISWRPSTTHLLLLRHAMWHASRASSKRTQQDAVSTTTTTPSRRRPSHHVSTSTAFAATACRYVAQPQHTQHRPARCSSLRAHLLGTPVDLGALGWGRERRNSTLAPLITYGCTPAHGQSKTGDSISARTRVLRAHCRGERGLHPLGMPPVTSCRQYSTAGVLTLRPQQLLCLCQLEHIVVGGAPHLHNTQHVTAQHSPSRHMPQLSTGQLTQQSALQEDPFNSIRISRLDCPLLSVRFRHDTPGQ